jgi:hypothetical protein
MPADRNGLTAAAATAGVISVRGKKRIWGERTVIIRIIARIDREGPQETRTGEGWRQENRGKATEKRDSRREFHELVPICTANRRINLYLLEQVAMAAGSCYPYDSDRPIWPYLE